MLCTIMCCFVKTTPVWPEHQFVYLLDVLPAHSYTSPASERQKEAWGVGSTPSPPGHQGAPVGWVRIPPIPRTPVAHSKPQAEGGGRGCGTMPRPCFCREQSGGLSKDTR